MINSTSGRLQSVVQLTFSGNFGGRENVAFSLAKILSERISNSLLYLVLETRAEEKSREELLKRLDAFEIRYRVFQTSTRYSRKVLDEIADALRVDGIQIVHCHCYKSAAYFLFARYFYGLDIRTAFTLHGLIIPFSLNSLFIYSINFMSLLLVDSIIGCSSEIVHSYRRMPFLRSKVSVIQNGLLADFSRTDSPEQKAAAKEQFSTVYQLDGSAFWIGNVGRLTKQKNFPFFLRAVDRIKKERHGGLNIQFLIAGNGELREELISLARELGIDDIVFFVGFVSDMDAFYCSLDILTLTSDWEGTPMCILEGMRHGLPIVASSVGGTVDLLEHEQSGLLFPNGDLAAFVNAAMSLADDPDARKRLGQGAYKRVREVFTPEIWGDRHTSLYESLL